jgi:hypothetical protein
MPVQYAGMSAPTPESAVVDKRACYDDPLAGLRWMWSAQQQDRRHQPTVACLDPEEGRSCHRISRQHTLNSSWTSAHRRGKGTVDAHGIQAPRDDRQHEGPEEEEATQPDGCGSGDQD